MDNVKKNFLENEEKIKELMEAGKNLAEADPSLSTEELRKKALETLGYKLTAEEVDNFFSGSENELSMEEMSEVAGGYNKATRCPVYKNAGHKFQSDGQVRKSDAWFYKTEEHYVCACGKGFWFAGVWSLRKWDD